MCPPKGPRPIVYSDLPGCCTQDRRPRTADFIFVVGNPEFNVKPLTFSMLALRTKQTHLQAAHSSQSTSLQSLGQTHSPWRWDQPVQINLIQLQWPLPTHMAPSCHVENGVKSYFVACCWHHFDCYLSWRTGPSGDWNTKRWLSATGCLLQLHFLSSLVSFSSQLIAEGPPDRDQPISHSDPSTSQKETVF